MAPNPDQLSKATAADPPTDQTDQATQAAALFAANTYTPLRRPAPVPGSAAFARCFDHTLLARDATAAQVDGLCEEARRWGFKVRACVLLLFFFFPFFFWWRGRGWGIGGGGSLRWEGESGGESERGRGGSLLCEDAVH